MFIWGNAKNSNTSFKSTIQIVSLDSMTGNRANLLSEVRYLNNAYFFPSKELFSHVESLLLNILDSNRKYNST